MEQKDNTLDNQLEILNAIEEVKVNHFFKHKVLQSIKQEQEIKESSTLYVWFTPKLQAAALVCFVFLNAAALLTYSAEQSYNERVSSFAEVYGLSETDTDSYLYQN
jgi:hypothetical protein